jgi:hypothetical protein
VIGWLILAAVLVPALALGRWAAGHAAPRRSRTYAGR